MLNQRALRHDRWDPELLATFLDESEESLQGVSALFIELEANPQYRHNSIDFSSGSLPQRQCVVF